MITLERTAVKQTLKDVLLFSIGVTCILLFGSIDQRPRGWTEQTVTNTPVVTVTSVD